MPRYFDPREWPNALRIVCLIAAGIWLLPLLAMWHKGSRHTWLPYAGIGLWLLVLVGAIFGGDEGSDSSAESVMATATATAAPTSTPAGVSTSSRSQTPTPTHTPTATPVPTEPPRWEALSGTRLTRIAEAVKDRDDCREDATTGNESWQAGQVVQLTRRGVGDCAGWLYAESPGGEDTWVRREYVSNPDIGPAVTEQIGSLRLTLYGIEVYDSTRDNIFNSANLRIIIGITNTGDDVYDMTLNSWQLFATTGLVYERDILCVDCPSDLSSVSLAPGGTVSGFIYFSAPEGTAFSTLRYAPLFSFNEADLPIP